MKTFYTLLFGFALSVSANAQTTPLQNPGFEDWDMWAQTLMSPDYWVFVPDVAGTCTQETTIVHGGLSSVEITAPSQDNQVAELNYLTPMTVNAGETYTLSYWYYDATDNAKGRIYAKWYAWGSTGNDDDLILENNPFQGDYQQNTNGWTKVTLVTTAPPTAQRIRVEFNVTGDVGNSGSIFFDDVEFFEGTMGINQNEISGLQVYPNPVTNGTLRIETSANAEKAIAVYDLLGKQVLTTKLQGSDLDVSGIKSGIYILKVVESDRINTSKLVIR